MKVAVIGGGSSYTPELVNGFLARVETFPLDELWLVDISQERLAVVGGFAQRMAEFRALYQSTLAGAMRELRGIEREEGSPVRSATPPKLTEA